MSILFAAKQVGHLDTIDLLLEHGVVADATIIARTMIEGMALLAWASMDPDDRARKWRAFSLVFDLRLMREGQSRGQHVSEADDAEFLERLRSEACVFLRKPGLDWRESGSYHTNWHVDRNGRAMRVSEIVRSVDEGGLISVYQHLSNWIHWNARGLASGIHRTGDSVRVQWGDESQAGAAVTGAFQSLHLGLRALNSHFTLGLESELGELRRQFLDASGISAI